MGVLLSCWVTVLALYLMWWVAGDLTAAVHGPLWVGFCLAFAWHLAKVVEELDRTQRDWERLLTALEEAGAIVYVPDGAGGVYPVRNPSDWGHDVP